MNNNTIPRTPFSTPLSGSAKETEMRLRNIFSGPKKRPPVLFLVLIFSVCLLCGNLVSCQVAEAEQDPPDASLPSEDISQPEPEEPKYLPASQLSFDLNQNGIPEEIRLESEYGRYEVQFYENGQLIDREQPGVCVYSYTGGPDHILRCYADDDYPGAYSYSYHIGDFSGEFEETIKSNSISFDLNFNAPFHTSFDPEAIAAYVEELTGPAGTPSLGLFSHAWRLVVRDEELVAEEPELTLPWLDAYPEIFTRDPDKSLVENLRDFQAAMTAACPAPKSMEELDVLPFDQPLDMIFLSGAGGWCTGLDLDPDGAFTGDYHDSDGAFTGDYHDSDGPIRYVCQFHGKLGSFVQLTECSWSLTLEELVLDTKYPVGKEWDEDGFHNISSQPNGFTDGDGKALRPGAQFILYSPEAKGDKPGTELYGARDLWDWCLSRPNISGGAPLGCWDLYNVEQRIGFFTDD